MSTPSAAIQTTFIAPTANITSIIAQQQPRQSSPCRRPSRNTPRRSVGPVRKEERKRPLAQRQARLLERGELIEAGAEEHRAADEPPDAAAVEQAGARQQRIAATPRPAQSRATPRHSPRSAPAATPPARACAPRCRRSRHRSGSSGPRSAASSPASSPSTSAATSASSPKPPRRAGLAQRLPVQRRACRHQPERQPAERRSAPRRSRARCAWAAPAPPTAASRPRTDGSAHARWRNRSPQNDSALPQHAEMAARIMVSGPRLAAQRRVRNGAMEQTWQAVNRRGGDRGRRPGRADRGDRAGRRRHRDRADRAAGRPATTAPPRCWRVPSPRWRRSASGTAAPRRPRRCGTMRIVDATARLVRAPEVRFAAAEIGLDAFGHNIENRHLLAALDARARDAAVADADRRRSRRGRNRATPA